MKKKLVRVDPFHTFKTYHRTYKPDGTQKSCRDVAEELNISTRTVERHLAKHNMRLRDVREYMLKRLYPTMYENGERHLYKFKFQRIYKPSNRLYKARYH